MRYNLVSCKNMDLQIQFHLETVTGEKRSQKERFVFRIFRFGKTVDQVNQYSVFSLLLFLIVVEAFSRETRSRCREELLYDLTFAGKSLSKGKLEAWKGTLESKSLRVNVKKTKMILSSQKTRKFWKEGKFLCAVCRKDVGNDSIICKFCKC